MAVERKRSDNFCLRAFLEGAFSSGNDCFVFDLENHR